MFYSCIWAQKYQKTKKKKKGVDYYKCGCKHLLMAPWWSVELFVVCNFKLLLEVKGQHEQCHSDKKGIIHRF